MKNSNSSPIGFLLAAGASAAASFFFVNKMEGRVSDCEEDIRTLKRRYAKMDGIVSFQRNRTSNMVADLQKVLDILDIEDSSDEDGKYKLTSSLDPLRLAIKKMAENVELHENELRVLKSIIQIDEDTDLSELTDEDIEELKKTLNSSISSSGPGDKSLDDVYKLVDSLHEYIKNDVRPMMRQLSTQTTLNKKSIEALNRNMSGLIKKDNN